MKLFSNKLNDDNKKDLTPAVGYLAGSAAAGGLGRAVTKYNGKKLHTSKITAKDSRIVREKLLDKAKNQGIKIVNDPNYNNSCYTGSGGGLSKKQIDQTLKDQEQLEKFIKDNPKLSKILRIKKPPKYSRTMLENLGKDRIVLGKGSLADTDVLSHELGHAQYMKSGRSKNIIGKISHKLRGPSQLAVVSNIGSAGAFYVGRHSGLNNEEKKAEGKKLSLWDKSKSVLIPTAAVAPLLVAEGAASLKGLKMMKEAGASKELLKQSKKRLGHAWGTYAGAASKPILLGKAGELTGKFEARRRNSRNKSSEKEE